jgi:hypothetical protein
MYVPHGMPCGTGIDLGVARLKTGQMNVLEHV